MYLHTYKAQAVYLPWQLPCFVLYGKNPEQIKTGSLRYKRKQQSQGQGLHLTREKQATCSKENSRREIPPDHLAGGQYGGLCYSLLHSLVLQEEYVSLATHRQRSPCTRRRTGTATTLSKSSRYKRCAKVLCSSLCTSSKAKEMLSFLISTYILFCGEVNKLMQTN